MYSRFQLFVITRPDFFWWESGYLNDLLEAGLPRLHIRKPGGSTKKMARLLGKISQPGRSRIVLHGDVSLAPEYGIPQVHYSLPACKKMREANIPARENLPFSSGLHYWEELEQVKEGLIPQQGDRLRYVFMSPLFETISKKGYTANSRLVSRPAGPLPCPVIGLGGISPDNIRRLMDLGWEGAAMLGWIWEEPKKAVERFLQVQKVVQEYIPGQEASAVQK